MKSSLKLRLVAACHARGHKDARKGKASVVFPFEQLSIHLFIFVYSYLFIFIHLYLHISTYLYLFMNFHIFISLYFYKIISLYLCIFIPLSLYLYIVMSLCLYVGMSLHGVFYIRVCSWEMMLWCCGPFAMCVCVSWLRHFVFLHDPMMLENAQAEWYPA